MSVVECKVTSFTGVSGIMIRETAETFGIITQDDKFRGNFLVIWFWLETTYDFVRSLVHLLVTSFANCDYFLNHLKVMISNPWDDCEICFSILVSYCANFIFKFEMMTNILEGRLQLSPRSFPSLCSKSIAGRLHCKETNSLPEMLRWRINFELTEEIR